LHGAEHPGIDEKQWCQSLNYEYGLTAPYNRDKLPAWLGHGG
jgi:hypothetical protein